MGEVYAADDTKLHRNVALKVLPAVFATDPDRRRRFEREAQAIASLNHPGIVTIHSIEVDGPVPFLTMELVEGAPLRDAIPKNGMRIDALLKAAIGVADAVAAAHQRGIVHRDLKPANVILCPDGRVKVLDFGLAKVHDAELAAAGEAPTHLPTNDLTGEGRIVGTVAYMSPEQAEGKPVDPRSDIFSLGVMLHEMATGDRPFKGDTEVSIISAIIKDAPPAVTDSRPELPLQLARIVKRCLIKDPQRRYQSARDLNADLEDLKQDIDSGVISGSSGTRAVAAPGRLALPKPVRYAVAALLVAGLAVAAWFAIERRLTASRMFVAGDFLRLTDSGTVFTAVLSNDGRYVVYTQQENGSAVVRVRQTATEGSVVIAGPADGRFNGVAFSPDGNFVYYSRYPRGSPFAKLFKVSTLGGTPTPLIDDVDSPIAFSRDGSRISFIRGRPVAGTMTLMVADADGSDARAVATSKAPLQFYSDERLPWSPDGRTILAVAHGSTVPAKSRLVAIDVASGRQTVVGKEWDDIDGVAWMPDGRSVLFVGFELMPTPHAELWQMDWPDGVPHAITTGLNRYYDLSVSADGNALVTIEDEFHSNIWIKQLPDGPAKQLTSNMRSSAGNAGVALMPDGRVLYGAPTDGAHPQIWIMDADGSHAKPLTTLSNFAAFPAVSSDGKWMAFNGGAGRSSIWKMPLEGGEPTRLTSGEADMHALISRDGKWVYYTADFFGRKTAMKVSADGGAETPLSPPEALFAPYQVWTDGARILGYGRNIPAKRNQAMLASPSGGQLEMLDNVPGNGGPLPDGTAWLFEDLRDGSAGLFLRPLNGGPDRRIIDLGQEGALNRAVTGDSKTLAFARSRETSDVVLIKRK
jgi:Tol biopolymer transport system component